MGVFDSQKFNWAGVEYAIPANRVLGAAARIEDVITLPELIDSMQKRRPPLAKIAMAWGAVLRYAGADVTDDDVYGGMFTDGTAQVQTLQSIMALLSLMIPKSAMDQVTASGAQAPGNAVPTGSSSSKRRTRPRSAQAG